MRSRFFYNICRRKNFPAHISRFPLRSKSTIWDITEVFIIIIKLVKIRQVNGFEKIYLIYFGGLSAAMLCGMQHRKDHKAGYKTNIRQHKAAGIDTEFHKYPGLGHGFGIGAGTVAEGWLDAAVSFREKQI